MTASPRLGRNVGGRERPMLNLVWRDLAPTASLPDAAKTRQKRQLRDDGGPRCEQVLFNAPGLTPANIAWRCNAKRAIDWQILRLAVGENTGVGFLMTSVSSKRRRRPFGTVNRSDKDRSWARQSEELYVTFECPSTSLTRWGP